MSAYSVTESSGEQTLEPLKVTRGVGEYLVMISSLVCVVDDASDWVDSGENSRPKSCETVIPVPSLPAMSPSVLGVIGYVV